VEKIPVVGTTRTNIAIKEEKTRKLFKLNEQGPRVKPRDIETCLRRMKRLLHQGDWVALSGSLPPGTSPMTYARFIRALKPKGVRILLDVDGKALREGLKGGPAFIKPNLHELARLVGYPLKTFPQSLKACKLLLQKRNLEGILLSMGKDGALLVTPQKSYLARTPRVKKDSAIGAGDSLVGGFLQGLSEGRSLLESFRLGMACGTATAITPATELCHQKDVLYFLKRISIRALT